MNNGPDPVTLIIVCAVIGLLPAAIAQSKGKNFVTWWIFGAALFILALPLALITPKDPKTSAVGYRRCADCGSTDVPADVPVCKHCGRDERKNAAAGWYPVPEGGKRFWDGTSWTEQTAP